MKIKGRHYLRKLARYLDLPEEIDLSVPKFTMVGASDLLVENHRGILEYGTEYLRLVTAEGVVRIDGDGLELTEFGSERVYVRGRISGWFFEERI